MGYKTNLKVIRKQLGYTQEQVARLTSIPVGTIRRWEQGVNEPDMGSIVLLARLYNTSTDTLLGTQFAEDRPGIVKATTDPFFSEVPVYGQIAAGTPIESMEPDETQPVPNALVKRYPHAFLVKVEGNSMNNILPDGSYAFINPCSEVLHDNMPHAVCVNGYTATVKRVHKLNNGFELVPDSKDPTYKKKVYDYGEEGTEEITIIGEVVYHIMPLDWSY